MKLILAFVLNLVAVYTPALAQPAPEVRGTWLTTTANDAISTPHKTHDTMRRLRDIGLNTVYVECWKNGYTEFPSEVMDKAIGVSFKINPSLKGVPALQRDLLQETLIAAHRNQLIYIAWFEYRFMVAHKDTHNELRKRRDWLVLDAAGNDVAKNGFVWLNPLHPDAQALLIGIVTEAIRTYDLDGIQLDDRIVWPSLEMGYDDFTPQALRVRARRPRAAGGCSGRGVVRVATAEGRSVRQAPRRRRAGPSQKRRDEVRPPRPKDQGRRARVVVQPRRAGNARNGAHTTVRRCQPRPRRAPPPTSRLAARADRHEEGRQPPLQLGGRRPARTVRHRREDRRRVGPARAE
jgi:hypothetical protein